MPALHKLSFSNLVFIFACVALLALTLTAAGTVQAAPQAAAPVTAPAAAAPATAPPDYGGRDSAPLTAAGDAAPNPAAQAGRALEALVVVLAGVAVVVYALKRFDLVRPGTGGKPARIAGPSFRRSPSSGRTNSERTDLGSAGVAVVSSQTLPGGTMLHVVRVGEKNLLLAATAQSVTSITEWSAAGTDASAGNPAEEFEDYLTRADFSSSDSAHSASGIAAANTRLRSLLSSSQPEERS